MITNTEARIYPGPGNLQRGSRPGSRLAYRLIAKVLTLVAVMLSASAAQSAQEQSASINSEVEAGENYTTRLRNLPKDAEVSVHIETSGEVAVLLINHRDYTAFPETKGPLFSGQITDSLDFSIRIPASGNYYLVLDNRKGEKKLEFKLQLTAKARAPDVTTSAETSEKLKQANQDLEKFEANLRQFFIFDELKFSLENCGTANAYNKKDTVIICIELGLRLYQMGDKQKARDMLMFTMMHEIGHVLLRQWGYPFYDNEELVDEFTTALLVMFNQGYRARSPAEYFSSLSPEQELETKRTRDDRHPLSIQRARNILRWLEEPDLVRRWQKIFVPHMQTTVLEALDKHPKTWTDRKLVEQELASRS